MNLRQWKEVIVMKLTLDKAKKMIEAARKQAEEMKIPMNIAVVDDGANLVAFERMEGAMIAGINISIDKAYTAAAVGFPTEELGKITQPGQLAYGAALADRGRLMVFAGGLPLKVGDKLLGGIGVSGGLAPDDKKVAEVGLSALEE